MLLLICSIPYCAKCKERAVRLHKNRHIKVSFYRYFDMSIFLCSSSLIGSSAGRDITGTVGIGSNPIWSALYYFLGGFLWKTM